LLVVAWPVCASTSANDARKVATLMCLTANWSDE
jgi:hypothetical protein